MGLVTDTVHYQDRFGRQPIATNNNRKRGQRLSKLPMQTAGLLYSLLNKKTGQNLATNVDLANLPNTTRKRGHKQDNT